MPDRYIDLVPAYFDNEIKAEERQDFEKHLISCTDCQQKLEDLKNLHSLLTAADEAEFMPASFVREELLAELPERRPARGAAFFHLGKLCLSEDDRGESQWFLWLVPVTILAVILAMQFAMRVEPLVSLTFPNKGLLPLFNPFRNFSLQPAIIRISEALFNLLGKQTGSPILGSLRTIGRNFVQQMSWAIMILFLLALYGLSINLMLRRQPENVSRGNEQAGLFSDERN